MITHYVTTTNPFHSSRISKIIYRKASPQEITKFLKLNDMLCKKQFGFRHDHSATTHALLELTEKIRD